MSFSISTQTYDILESGTVIVPYKEFVDFKIENLCFRFIFEENEKDGDKLKESYFRVSKDDSEDCLKITIVNIRNSINATNTKISNLATIKGKDLYVKFCINAINANDDSCDYMFSYTWYLSK